MRILAIRGRNLASLAGDFSIDFEAEPLAGSGIFAITGPTGSGKSTLLDALCLALFNRVPRLEAAPNGAQIPDGSDQEISAGDPRAILRHGTGEGYAEVDFAMSGGRRYRARWSVQRARQRPDGRLQNIQHSFERLDTGERLGGTRTETLAAIRDVIGLTAEQFGRAVLLAQGEFEAFIRADANERAVLLERLTGSGIYARLGRHAYEKASGLRAQLEEIRRQIAAQNGLDDEQRGAAEAELAAARGEETAAASRLGQLSQAQQWENRAAELGQSVSAAERLEAEALAATEAARPRREALTRDRAAFAHASDWTAVQRAMEVRDEAASRLIAATERAEHIAGEEAQAITDESEAQAVLNAHLTEAQAIDPEIERARVLDQQLAESRSRLAEQEAEAAKRQQRLEAAAEAEAQTRAARDSAEATHRAHVEWLAEHSDLQPLAQREDELVDHIAEYALAVEQHSALVSQKEDLNKAQLDATTVSNNATGALDEALARHAEAVTALTEAEAALPDERRVSELTAAHERLGKAALLANDLSHAITGVTEAEKAMVAAREIETAIGDRLCDAEARKRIFDEELPHLRSQRDDARRELGLLTAAASDTAETLRAGLNEGEPCPVCGSKEHELATFEGKLGEHLRIREGEIKALEATVEAQEQAAFSLAADIRALSEQGAHVQRELADKTRALSEATDRRDRALAEVQAAATDLGLSVTEADFSALISSRCEIVQSELSKVQGAREKVEARRKTERQAHAALDKARLNQTHAREALEAQNRAIVELDHALVSQGGAADRHAVTLDRVLSPLVDWRALPDAVTWLRQHASEWRDQEEGRDRIAATIPNLRTQCEQAAIALSASRARAQDGATAVSTSRHEHDTLVAARANLLAGEAVAEVQARLSNAQESASQALAASRNKREAAAQARVAAETTRAEALRSRDETQEDYVRREANFLSGLRDAGLDAEDVARVAQAGQAALDAESEALSALERALGERRAVLAKCREDWERHQEVGRPELLGPDLAATLNEADAAHKAAAARCAEAELKIRLDDQVRTRTAELRADLERQSATADIWLKLSDLIGDREGRTFRRFAQGLTLDRLLDHANARLADLKPRYSLERGAGGDMLIQVADNDMAGEVRGLHNLSGGERFLISLALALGLAEMSTTSGVRIESLFIDEGFGALDPASLGHALALLEHLHASGRRVGVISHVEELKERIPVKIEVVPIGRGTSRIDLAAA